jgi:hypothetical protein
VRKLQSLGHGAQREEESSRTDGLLPGQVEFQRQRFVDSATVESPRPCAVQNGIRAPYSVAKFERAADPKWSALGFGHGLTQAKDDLETMLVDVE